MEFKIQNRIDSVDMALTYETLRQGHRVKAGSRKTVAILEFECASQTIRGRQKVAQTLRGLLHGRSVDQL